MMVSMQWMGQTQGVDEIASRRLQPSCPSLLVHIAACCLHSVLYHKWHLLQLTTAATDNASYSSCSRERFLDWLDNVDWKDVGVEAESFIPFAKGINTGKKTYR